MPFCRKCGSQLTGAMKFCTQCGTPVAVNAASTTTEISIQDPCAAIADFAPSFYEGEARSFSVSDGTIDFPAHIDAYIYYRKHFTQIAKELSRMFFQEYSQQVRNLDDFILKLPAIYQKYRKPIFDIIGQILIEAEIYDVSVEQIAEKINNSNLKINEHYVKICDDFNATIRLNQERISRNWSMLPTMIFSGIGGFVIGTALNFAVSSAAESTIRNANVSTLQRHELYQRIDPAAIETAVYEDYFNMHKWLIDALVASGKKIWSKSQISPQETGIYQNLFSNRIPVEKQKVMKIELLKMNPVNGAYCELLEEENDPELDPVITYVKCS